MYNVYFRHPATHVWHIDMYVYTFYAWVLNSVLCRQYTSTCTCIYRCVLYIDMYILYMQVLNECHTVTEFVSCRLTSILHACTVQFVCTHMDVCITMYIYTLYMQVLNECHTVTEFVSCRLTSVYMYLHACTVQFVCTHMYVCMYNVHNYTFFTCRCSMGVSQLVTNIVGVLSCLYTSNVYCAVVCTHMEYIVYMQVLNGCLGASNRQNWCPAASVYIYMYLQVCTVQLYAHTWT